MISDPSRAIASDSLTAFLGSWQVDLWTAVSPSPKQLEISAIDGLSYRLDMTTDEGPIQADLVADRALRHLQGRTVDGRSVRVAVWPGTETDRLVVTLDQGQTVIGAQRPPLRLAEGWTLSSFLLEGEKRFKVIVQAGPSGPRNPDRQTVYFKAVGPVGPYTGLFDIYYDDDQKPYDRLLFEPGNGALVSLKGWRSVALDPTGSPGCLFAMYDPRRILGAGGQLMPFELPVDDDIGVWGAEEG